MAEGIKCPQMKWGSGDDQAALLDYRTRLNRWFVIKNIKTAEQHNYIIFQAGEKGEELSKTWTLTNEELRKPDNVWDKFNQSVGLADNFRVHRLNLTACKQKEGESIDEFYTRCRALALKCKFKDLDDRLIDQLIIGTRVHESRKELLKEDDQLTIDDALNKCRTQEASEAHMKAFENVGTTTTNVDAIHRKRDTMKTNGVINCKFCATDHPYGKCPAYHATCSNCGKTGHWKIRCKYLSDGHKNHTRRQFAPKRQTRNDAEKKPRGRGNHGNGNHKTVHTLQVESDDENENFSFDVINANNRSYSDGRDIIVNVDTLIPGYNQVSKMKCKVDTGAQGNVLPMRTFKNMFPSLISPKGPVHGNILQKRPHVQLNAYNGTEINQHGSVNLKLRYGNDTWHETEFFVADTPGSIILGKDASQLLNIITVNTVAELTLRVSDIGTNAKPITDTSTLVNTYPDRFTGIGKFPGKFHIDVKPDVTPVVNAPRKYPIHLKDEIQAELDKMTKLGVIEPIPENESTEWLNSLAFSRKESGSLRVCLDPRNLNTAIKRTYHRAPTVEEITHKPAGAKVFSKLDARHCYWSIELDNESAALTSFSTPRMRYRFRRLPFGLRVSQDVFQEKMDMILAGCKGTMSIADDIVVYGHDETDHDNNLHNLMIHARKYGLVFNPNKCCSSI